MVLRAARREQRRMTLPHAGRTLKSTNRRTPVTAGRGEVSLNERHRNNKSDGAMQCLFGGWGKRFAQAGGQR